LVYGFIPNCRASINAFEIVSASLSKVKIYQYIWMRYKVKLNRNSERIPRPATGGTAGFFKNRLIDT
jgi:hypothetical protein